MIMNMFETFFVSHRILELQYKICFKHIHDQCLHVLRLPPNLSNIIKLTYITLKITVAYIVATTCVFFFRN